MPIATLLEETPACVAIAIQVRLQTKKRPRFDSRSRRAYQDEKYSAWKTEVELDLARLWKRSGKSSPIAKLKKLAIQFYGTSAGAGDLEGLFGATTDALVKSGVLLDDRLNVVSHIESAWERTKGKTNERIEVYLMLPEINQI